MMRNTAKYIYNRDIINRLTAERPNLPGVCHPMILA